MLGSLSAIPTAEATTFEEGLTLRRVWELSTYVVVADVVAQEVVVAMPGAPSPIETHSELRVSEYLKGRGPTSLTVRQLGGATPSGIIRIEGDAELAVGQRAVLFVTASDDPRYRPFVHLTALGYSVYSLEHEVTGVVAQPSLSAPTPSSSSTVPMLGQRVTWDRLRPFILRGAR